MFKNLILVLLVVSMMLTGFAFAQEEAAVEHAPVAILYTNDVHCGIDDEIGYAGIAAYEKAYQAAGYETALVDCGDAVQGGPVGTLSKGSYIIDIMNEVGYDVATIGNHEFDYGMEQFMALAEQAEFPYVAANFADMDGNPVFDAYVIKEMGGWKIAFVGAATPETYTKSTPTYFMDENGNFIYNFSEGNNGANLYAAIQTAVDNATNEGADFVVVLSHLGTDAASEPYTSSSLIVNTNGIDVVLDGHSHSIWEQEKILNKDGEEVILSSTGTKIENVGTLIIDEEGAISTSLHSESIFQDAETAAFVDSIKAQYEESLEEVVATTAVDLTIKDPATGERAVRSAETNLGDLNADAYRFVAGADIGWVNGGGVRDNIAAGEVTYGDILKVNPFGNMLCVVEATGQKIADALEMGVSKLPGENGGFLQVSGLTFEIDMSVESTVVLDEQLAFVEVAGDRRVKNIMVNGEPIDLEKTYTLASHNYMLKDGGDGVVMFMDCPLLKDEIMLDNQVLMTYIIDHLDGVIGEEYADPYGQGRITFVE